MSHSTIGLLSRFGLIAFLSLSSLNSHAKESCVHCSDLTSVVNETKKESKKKKFDVDALQLRATAVIQQMPDAKKVVTPEQIRVILQAFLASIPHDPARAIIENNIEIVKDNRDAFNAEIAKLPKEKGDDLKEAIAISISADTEGTDPQ